MGNIKLLVYFIWDLETPIGTFATHSLRKIGLQEGNVCCFEGISFIHGAKNIVSVFLNPFKYYDIEFIIVVLSYSLCHHFSLLTFHRLR